MPIKIKCPSCQAILGVKESLAGKKANCPRCRFVLTIPMPKAPVPAPAPPPDAEALAASAFADEPAPAVPASTQVIEFECPFCAEMVKVSAELAGKQTPCTNPECKRIVKVPLLKEGKPKDWRTVNPRGPLGAINKNADQPENAWSTAQKTRVSTEALIEADAIPQKKAPVTFRTVARRVLLATVALVILIAAVWGVSAWMSSNRLYDTFNTAVEAADKAKLKPAQAAAINRGAGEFYVAMRQAPKAKEHFGKARALLMNPTKKQAVDLEKDSALTELALAMVDLGGSESEELDLHRLEWSKVQDELAATLRLLSCDESKQVAMREVGCKLVAKDQAGIAVFLARQLATPPPQAQPDPAEDGQEVKKAPDTAKERLAAQQIGLLLALKDGAAAKQIMAPPNLKDKGGVSDGVVRLAWAEGWAREGNFTDARALALLPGTDTPLDRIEASLAVAAVALLEGQKDAARINLQDALNIFHKEKDLKKEDKVKRPGLLLQLARIAARLDMADEAKRIAAYMPDNASKSLALLELVTAQIATAKESVTTSLVDELPFDKESLAYGLALEKIARHNTRLGQRSEALALAEGLDDRLRAFVYMGVALGMVDAR
jgi:hypothetical protein